MTYTREERRKFRKRWRVAARHAHEALRVTLGIGHRPTPVQMAARKRLVERHEARMN